MIDPRALQQHFRKVQQSEIPPKIEVPRVPDLEPLTAIQAIPEPVIEQKQIPIPAPDIFNSLKEETNLTVDLIDTTPIVINDEIVKEEEKEKLIVPVKEDIDKDVYDPYGYYSSSNNN
jgi:hypothetical protein